MAYYFTVAALPPIILGTKPEMSFKEVRQLLALNLSSADLKQVAALTRLVDLMNLKALWLGIPLDEWDEKGNYSAKELEEALLVSEALPEFLVDFLQKYEATHERLRYFPALYGAFLNGDEHEGFLKKYFQLEREIQLILTALRSKIFHRDLLREFQFEDPQDPFVAYLIAQKDSPDLSVPQEYEDLKALFSDNISDPMQLHRAILEYRFKKIEELEEERAPFGIEAILGYLARLIIAEDLQELDQEKGHAILEQLSENG